MKMKFQYVILFVMILSKSYTQDLDLYFEDRVYKERPKIGIALSGGAAHGLAHVGVIKYLDELGVDIDYVTGTSMGAIIGALHAMGHSGVDMEKIASELDWNSILNNDIQYKGVAPIEKFYHDKYPLNFVISNRKILLPQGILNTNRLDQVLASLFSPAIGIKDFHDLPRPFRCFGVDIEEGELVTLDNGRLPQALRASMAIPSVFSPKLYQGKWLVDGGLMHNFPVSDAYDMGADIVIGSYVGREKSDISELGNLIEILSESAFMMSISDSNKEKDNLDILLCPEVKDVGVFGFEDYQKIIDLGYEAAKSRREELLKILKIQDDFDKPAPRKVLSMPSYLFIDSIKISDVPKPDADLALDKFAFLERSHMSYAMIERGVARITSTLNFESVSYQIIKTEEKNTLLIIVKPRKERKIGLNINHFFNTNSSLILSGQVRNLFFRLSNLRATLRLSESPAILADYFVRGGFISKNLVFGLKVSAEKEDKRFFSRGFQRKNGFIWEGHIKPYITYEFNNSIRLTTALDLRRFDYRNLVQSQDDIKTAVNLNNRISTKLSIDTRDRQVLPKSGINIEASIFHGSATRDTYRYNSEDARDNLDLPRSKDHAGIDILFGQTKMINKDLWWSSLLSAFYMNKPLLLDNYQIGGTSQRVENTLPFIGYRATELASRKHLYARTDLRIKIYEEITIALIANALIGENPSFRYSEETRNPEYYAFGFGAEIGIMTPLGPILLDLGYNSESEEIITEISVGWRHVF